MYRILPLLFLPLAALAVNYVPQSGFIDSCQNISLIARTDGFQDSTWLSATCQTAGGPGKKNELPLDRCLGYSPSKGLHGKLMCVGPSGLIQGFINTLYRGRAFEGAYCYECTPGPAPGVIRCVCATGGRSSLWIIVFSNTNECITDALFTSHDVNLTKSPILTPNPGCMVVLTKDQ